MVGRWGGREMLGLTPAKRTTWRWYEIERSGRTDIQKFKRLCRRACRMEIWAALIPYGDQLDNIGTDVKAQLSR